MPDIPESAYKALESELNDLLNSQTFVFYEKHNPDGTVERYTEGFEKLIQAAVDEGYREGEKSMRGYNDTTLVWKKVNEALEKAAQEIERHCQSEACVTECWHGRSIRALKDAK